MDGFDQSLKQYRVRPGARANLDRWDPNDASAFEGGKDDARTALEKLTVRLGQLQELLYADHRHALLVVLQGMDSAGKDGTIRRVFQGVNPQGVRVASFKKPCDHELEHDFLWRVHAEVPARGEVVLFNRSHYEDVLITRVHGLITRPVWERRYREINDFERALAEEGTTVLKFYLHISRSEQKQRLTARMHDRSKQWKFRESDLQERRRWPEYMTAYEEAITRTSTKWAPWYVVPANRKWFRDLLVSGRIVSTLEGFRLRFPPLPREFRASHVR